MTRKRQRQQTLLRLVSERDLGTQAELVSALRASGYEATQATVSRDIEELGLAKVARDGRHVYAPPALLGQSGGEERLRRFCEDYPVEVDAAANLLVLRSLPGTANALAAALDATRLAEIVGTLAGDDTVFVAVRSERQGRALAGRLGEYGVRRRAAAE